MTLEDHVMQLALEVEQEVKKLSKDDVQYQIDPLTVIAIISVFNIGLLPNGFPKNPFLKYIHIAKRFSKFFWRFFISVNFNKPFDQFKKNAYNGYNVSGS